MVISETLAHGLPAEALSSVSVYLGLERNLPCPNSVVESLASGTPVVGYVTGSLPEPVPEDHPGLASD